MHALISPIENLRNRASLTGSTSTLYPRTRITCNSTQLHETSLIWPYRKHAHASYIRLAPGMKQLAMVSSGNSFYLSVMIFIVLITRAIDAQPDFLYHFCLGNNITTNSTYHSNLNHLLSTLPSNSNAADNSGFYNSSYGQNSDRVYAIGLCRGDSKPDACRSCLNNSTYRLAELCPNREEAIGWYDGCMLRYSNRTIFEVTETFPRFFMWNLNNVSSSYADGFKQVLTTLLGDLKGQAAAGGSLRKYATGSAIAPSFQTIYALVQCTPDLSLTQCTSCLDDVIGDIPRCCDGKIGGRVISPSCNFRYEISMFYEPNSIAETPPPTSPVLSPPSTSNTSIPSTTQGIIKFENGLLILQQ